MFCPECGGEHELSGSRIDCIRHWQKRAFSAENELLVVKIYFVEPMRVGIKEAANLLSRATPNAKVIPLETEQTEWASNFGKWWAAWAL